MQFCVQREGAAHLRDRLTLRLLRNQHTAATADQLMVITATVLSTIDKYLIYTFHGVEITRYPAIEKYLLPYKEALKRRATDQAWYELQQPQRRFSAFMEKPRARIWQPRRFDRRDAI